MYARFANSLSLHDQHPLHFLSGREIPESDSIHRNRLSVVVSGFLCSTLLCLLGLDLSKLLLATALVSLSASLGVQAVVPPAEAGGIVANELLVVKIVVGSTGPDGKEVSQTPGEVVATVRVDGLEKTEDDPGVHSEEVELASNGKEDNGASDNTNSEESCFDGRSVLSGETERSRVGVVHLVDGLVERTVVQSTVEPVVPSILHDEADSDLESHLPNGREGHTVVHTEVGSDGVEEPDLRKFGGEMADKNDGGAIPLLLEGGNLLLLNSELLEIGDVIHHHVGNTAAEVDELVKHKTHDAGREGIVLHPEVPSGPELFDNIELDIVLGDLLEDNKVVLGLVKGREGGRV